MIILLFIFELLLIAELIRNSKYVDSVNYIINSLPIGNKLRIFLISSFSGILPIPGRIALSCAFLTQEADNFKDKESAATVAYLASHHYYLWSPFEKAILITTAGVGITYGAFIGLIAPTIITYMGCLLFFINTTVNDTNKIYSQTSTDPSNLRFVVSCLGLLFTGIISSIAMKWEPAYTFLPLLALTLIGSESIINVFEALKKLNYKVLGMCLVAIGVGEVIKQYNSTLIEISKGLPSVYYCVAATFVASWFMGSSSKYAGLTVMGCLLYGIEYLPLFYTVDFCGYLLSPTHKCLPISVSSFSACWSGVYSKLAVVGVALFLVASLVTLI